MYIPSVNSIMAAGLALTGMPEMLKGRTLVSPSYRSSVTPFLAYPLSPLRLSPEWMLMTMLNWFVDWLHPTLLLLLLLRLLLLLVLVDRWGGGVIWNSPPTSLSLIQHILPPAFLLIPSTPPISSDSGLPHYVK